MNNNFIRVVGLKLNAFNCVEIVIEKETKDFKEASKYADECEDKSVIFVGIPCHT